MQPQTGLYTHSYWKVGSLSGLTGMWNGFPENWFYLGFVPIKLLSSSAHLSREKEMEHMDQFEMEYYGKELAGHKTCPYQTLMGGNLHLGDSVKDIWIALTAKH